MKGQRLALTPSSKIQIHRNYITATSH